MLVTNPANDLFSWFPRLEATGVPVPRTVLVSTDVAVIDLLDGRTPHGFTRFLDDLQGAAHAVGGFPIFLRTGYGSGKHAWRMTCYVPNATTLASHVAQLVEWSELVDLAGLPTDHWVVRELLDLDADFTAFWGDLPIAQERRVFIEGPAIVHCDHPYWPPEALAEARPSVPDWQARLAAQDTRYQQERETVLGLARLAARGFTGAWSLDLARRRDGQWVAIDMARADESWHWPGCPVNRWTRPEEKS